VSKKSDPVISRASTFWAVSHSFKRFGLSKPELNPFLLQLLNSCDS
jgi:hypothetical protein